MDRVWQIFRLVGTLWISYSQQYVMRMYNEWLLDIIVLIENLGDTYTMYMSVLEFGTVVPVGFGAGD